MSSLVDEQAAVRSRPASAPWQRLLSRGLALARLDHIGAQAVRFVITGAVVSIVYVSVTTFLSQASHVAFELALAIGWSTGICVHFTLQRTFVWARQAGFALPLSSQMGRYLLVAGSQFGLTAASTALLPAALGLPVEEVYLVTVALLTSVNFLVFRNGIFHAEEPVLAGPVGNLAST
ncbi:MAG TPA: GtrA family protein [Solirubrobacteraceae bacterium]|nr:GtrA family protein [Solirubrobacteraceae bacterium]